MRQIRETTAIAKAGEILQWQWILMVGGGGGGGVKGWQRARCISTVGMYCSFYVEPRSFLNVQKTTSIYTNKK